MTILVSALGVFIMYGNKKLSDDIYYLLGAGFPLIFKKIVSAASDNGKIRLGDSVIKKYFGPS